MDNDLPLSTRSEMAARLVHCPTCKARVAELCHTPTGVLREDSHVARYDQASRCGLMPVR